MPRSNSEWIGKTDDSMPSDEVRRRICERQGWICACGCTRKMNYNIDRIDIDHKLALADGGENRESNLQAMFHDHHVEKTRVENSQRAEARRHQYQAFTRPPSKWQSRGFAKAPEQHRASAPLAEKFPGDILSRKQPSDRTLP